MEITLDQTDEVLRKAKAKAQEIGVAVNIALLDTGGHLKSLQRMDDAFIGSIDIAIRKAKTAMLFRMPSEQLGEFVKPEVAAYGLEYTNGGLVALPVVCRSSRTVKLLAISGSLAGQFSRMLQSLLRAA
jgi:uncharacterized protein GlcG (DUF336 family)